MKQCSKCKQTKSLNDFYKGKINKDGYRCQCKECIDIKNEEWKIKNKEKHYIMQRKWWLKNKCKFIKGNGFQMIRKKILKRDNYQCQTCGKKANEVHHKDETGSNRPISEQNNKVENLITLCHRCHTKLHPVDKTTCTWEEKEDRNKKIFELSKKMSQTAISKRFRITRQRVHQIIKKLSTEKV